MSDFDLIEREATSTLDRARELVVTCDEEYSVAGNFIMDCKSLIAKIKAEFLEPKRKADEAHKAICAMETRTLGPVQDAMRCASDTALDWKREQDRLAKAEADRIAAEKRQQDEEARLAEASRLEAEGKPAEAEEVLNAQPPPMPRHTPFISPVPKVAGLSPRGNWKGEIINQRLVKREFCLADQSLINSYIGRFWPKGTQVEKKTLTEEQKKALEDEIGGVHIYFDGGFTGRVG